MKNAASVLGVMELRQKNKIAESVSPYIGLIPELLSEKDYQYVLDALKATPGTYGNLVTGLKKYPALFVSYIVESIQIHMGVDSNTAVYGCLNLALNKQAKVSRSEADKEDLWHAFRRACRLLGLPVSNRKFGPNFMVDAYLEQVAVFDSARDDVNAKLDLYAKKNGIPDKFDSSECQSWFQDFLDTVGKRLQVRVKRALINDRNLFYVGQFLESVESKEITSGKPAYAQSQLPKLCFDGQNLKLSFVPNDQERWSISVDDETSDLEPDELVSSFYLEGFDTKRIMVGSSTTNQSIEFNLWQNDQDNQFIIFEKNSGHFLSAHSLVEEGVTIKPGVYLLLSRFTVLEDWFTTSDITDSEFDVGEFVVNPGEVHRISRGPTTFYISANSQAMISIEGLIIAPAQGEQFLKASTATITTLIPEEWEMDEEYELEINCLATNEKVIHPVALDEHNTSLTLEFKNINTSWIPCFSRVQIKLRVSGKTRVLAQASFLAWFGLSELSEGWAPICAELPRNIEKETCDNLYIDEVKAALQVKDELEPYIKLSFLTRPGSTNRHKITFAQPGTYLYLSDPINGQSERPLVSGSNLVGNYRDRRLLRVFSTESVELWFGDTLLHDKFDKRSSVLFRVAGLLDKIQKANRKSSNLLYTRHVGTGKLTPLLRIISRHNLDGWHVNITGKRIGLKIVGADEVKKLQLIATEALSQRTIEIELTANEGGTTLVPGEISGILISSVESTELSLDTSMIPDGFWFFDVKGKVSGRWGAFRNERKDRHALGLIKFNGELIKGDDELYRQTIETLSLEEKTSALEFVNEILSDCYALSCWESMGFLKDIWENLVYDEAVVGDGNARNVVSYCRVIPDETASKTWVRLIHIGGFNPKIFTREAIFYKNVHVTDDINLRCLKLMHVCQNDLARVVREERVHPAVALAFSNRLELSRDSTAEPTDLDVDQFRETLLSGQSKSVLEFAKKPKSSELLTYEHLFFAQSELVKHWRRSSVGYLHIRSSLATVALHFASKSEHTPARIFSDEFFLEEQEQLVIHALFVLVLEFARVSRLRDEEALTSFQRECESLMPSQDVDPRLMWSLMLNISTEYFHFYLLVWEIYFNSQEK